MILSTEENTFSPALILHHVGVFYLLNIFCALLFQSILKSRAVFGFDNIVSSIE